LLNVTIPGNAEIYIKQFRSLVDFDVFKPDVFLPLINPKWSVAHFTNLGAAKVKGNLAATGVTTGSIAYNLQTYILFLIIFVFFMLFLAALAIVRNFRAKITTLIINILKKTFFNNSVRSINLSYLKSALAFVIAIELFNESNKKAASKAGAIIYIPIMILGSIPLICFAALYYYQDRLEEQAIKDRIEKMYVDISLRRNSYAKYIYPIFLCRRFIYVLIPILFPDNPVF